MTQSFVETAVVIGQQGLEGVLRKPSQPQGLVIFAHGSGSSRLSPRNSFVAEELSKRGFATLLFDLLTEEEGRDRRNVFDIPLLGDRVVEAIEWASRNVALRELPIGLFGASTGAGAALVASAATPALVSAVVSRGGRPDLAEEALPLVKAPTLLIVGGLDDEVIELNRAALGMLRCEARLDIVPGATHLFEEAGALETVVSLAIKWFGSHLSAG
ncbi:dienelactone hydrolase family protein [Methylocystis sp. MJC1]|jgi:dienelactone hydrolase|uniref:dienelactone hydrolase family protein n=1 Tax=Methylocystis sp. MJC1 TaxID=2654282 RepID=UPI0013EAF09D|nr:dienelactone hydrolase family protein [Methylocystis sp. MJC1]KAF2992509.1 putative phosphoribosyl transferase [Methylocystis sp. MJC1]MBU6526485.1 dienelactone hydrolase family protein [Methylocystis sp. MJC1]UZX12925.1 dienelactone hydrolase family protein [Methylocystis sp. MJC1]